MKTCRSMEACEGFTVYEAVPQDSAATIASPMHFNIDGGWEELATFPVPAPWTAHRCCFRRITSAEFAQEGATCYRRPHVNPLKRKDVTETLAWLRTVAPPGLRMSDPVVEAAEKLRLNGLALVALTKHSLQDLLGASPNRAQAIKCSVDALAQGLPQEHCRGNALVNLVGNIASALNSRLDNVKLVLNSILVARVSQRGLRMLKGWTKTFSNYRSSSKVQAALQQTDPLIYLASLAHLVDIAAAFKWDKCDRVLALLNTGNFLEGAENYLEAQNITLS